MVGAVTTPSTTRAVARTADPPPRTAPPASVIVDVHDGRSLDSLPTDTTAPPEPATQPQVQPAIMRPIELEPPLVAPFTVVVEPGDNLWDLSATTLARVTGRERAALGDDEIARYWNVVCDANRATVRSGDVNLIYPGEAVVLPPGP